MNTRMNAWETKIERERGLWAESREREYRLVDQVIAPWLSQRIAGGTPLESMMDHPAADELIEAVDRWCEEYAQWRQDSGLAFVNGYPVEDWAPLVPEERRAAVLFRVANHLEKQGEPERADNLRRWGLRSLAEHRNSEN